MKKLLLISFILFSISVVFGSTDHPIKLTSSQILYDVKSKSILVECKVFIDDFAPNISSSLHTSLNQSNLTKDDKSRIEIYFSTNYKILINSKPLDWKIKSYKVADNILTLIFMNTNINLKKGDNLQIENTMLFEAFGDLQSNWMTIRFPPYIGNYNFESKIEDSVYFHTF